MVGPHHISLLTSCSCWKVPGTKPGKQTWELDVETRPWNKTWDQVQEPELGPRHENQTREPWPAGTPEPSIPLSYLRTIPPQDDDDDDYVLLQKKMWGWMRSTRWYFNSFHSERFQIICNHNKETRSSSNKVDRLDQLRKETVVKTWL